MNKKLKLLITSNRILYHIYLLNKGKRPLINRVKKRIRGKGNLFHYSRNTFFFNSKIDIRGNNNLIRIGENCSFKNVTFYIKGNNNTINISDSVIFFRSGELWIEDDNSNIIIGESSTFEQSHLAVTESNSKITIGSDCMFAYDIDVRTGDSHSILELDSSKRINYAKDVVIENHVWVASHCSILKGVTVKENSVVATRSVLTSSIDKAHVIVGGIPAKILKENISWDRNRI